MPAWRPIHRRNRHLSTASKYARCAATNHGRIVARPASRPQAVAQRVPAPRAPSTRPPSRTTTPEASASAKPVMTLSLYGTRFRLRGVSWRNTDLLAHLRFLQRGPLRPTEPRMLFTGVWTRSREARRRSTCRRGVLRVFRRGHGRGHQQYRPQRLPRGSDRPKKRRALGESLDALMALARRRDAAGAVWATAG